jgi:hypothetical protein
LVGAGADIGERQRLLRTTEQGQDGILLRIQVLLQHGRGDLLLSCTRLLRQGRSHQAHIHTLIPSLRAL